MAKYDLTPGACRVCLRKSRSCRSMFKSINEKEIAPSEKLKLVSGVTVIENDNDFPTLPQSICRPCEISLNMAFSLRTTARKSDQVIHYYCNKMNNDHIILELNTGRKFKLSKELTLKVIRNNKPPEPFPVLKVREDLKPINSDEREDCQKPLVSECSNAIAKEVNKPSTQKRQPFEHNQENEKIEISSDDSFCCSDSDNDFKPDESDEDVDVDVDEDVEIIDVKKAKKQQVNTQLNSDIKTEINSEVKPELNPEVKPQKVYNPEEIAKRLDASDKYEVVSWKQENAENAIPIFKLRLKNMPTKQPSYDFICDVCGNTYQQRHRLNEHMRRHAKEKRFECEICSKAFSVPEGLRRHILTHGAKKPYKCSLCTRRFYNPSEKKAHEKIHSGAKPYVCKICDKAFAYSCSLAKHMLIHQNKKLYRCEYCLKEFRLQHHLKQHEETQIHKDTVAVHRNSE